MSQDARTHTDNARGFLDAATLTALAAGLHGDPFPVLGPHPEGVRVYAPGALGVEALEWGRAEAKAWERKPPGCA